MASRLANRLTQARRQRFVGRRAELELFRAALGRDVPDFAVLHLVGPGGMGKTTLLREYAQIAEEAGRGLDTPAIYQVIKDAEPLTEPATHKIPSNLRRRYDRLARFPQGYLVMGDALASFNPVYGQGMSVAALESAALDDCLAQGDDRLAERFFKQAGKIIDIPWSTAVGNDLRFPEVAGPRNGMVRFINWYISKLHHAAQHDPVVSVAFLKVVNLVESPPSVIKPGIMWRVLRGNLWAKAGNEVAGRETAVAPELV